MTRVVDVHLGPARLASEDRVEVQLGGVTAQARVLWLGGGFHALRGELPEAAPGDPVVAAGAEGVVLDPDAPRRGTSNDRLVRLTGVLRSLA